METKPEYAITKRQQITPQLWEMLKDIGKAFHAMQKMGIHSGAEGTVKALFCLESGLPLTSARALYFVNGRLGIESGIIAALIRKHPNYDYNIKHLDETGCTVEILRDGEVIGEATFNEEHAKRAGLLQKQGYQKYPDDLYFAKAITRAQRRFAPDVFMAPVYSSEEMSEWDVIDAEIIPQTPSIQVPPLAEIVKKFTPILKVDGLQATGILNAQTQSQLASAYVKVLENTRQVLIDQFGEDAFVQAGGDLSAQMDEDWLFEVADNLAKEGAEKESENGQKTES